MDEPIDPIGKVNDMAERIAQVPDSDPLDKRFPQELIDFVKAVAEAIEMLNGKIDAIAAKIEKRE